MAKGNMLYQVRLFADFEDRKGRVIYETSKKDKAERFLHDYVDSHDDAVRLSIDSVYNSRTNKRDRYEDEE